MTDFLAPSFRLTSPSVDAVNSVLTTIPGICKYFSRDDSGPTTVA
jgi:hypothetical protein